MTMSELRPLGDAYVDEFPANRQDIIAAMQEIAPFHQDRLDLPTYRSLAELTEKLIEVEGQTAESEYTRYIETSSRGLELPKDKVYEQFHGKTVLVTGGTGLIGSSFMQEIAPYRPERMVSFSRGEMPPHVPIPSAEYRYGDIRNAAHMSEIMHMVRPDIVVHIAADKYNHLAEGRARHTLTTNIDGTQNVINAAEEAGVSRFIYASTGKATRPYSPDVYASSKKTGEWLVSEAALRGNMVCSAGRFTHVVDSSYLIRTLNGFIEDGQAVSIHDPDTLFYVQSAKESAHLLINSTLEAEPGHLKIQAIRDLGMPINLLDLGIGAIAHAKLPAAIYIKGTEAGYEEKTWEGLYHPSTAGDISPLINALESDETEESATCAAVDSFPLVLDESEDLIKRFDELKGALREDTEASNIRELNHEFSWELLKARLEAVSDSTLARTRKHVEIIQKTSGPHEDHDKLNEIIIDTSDKRIKYPKLAQEIAIKANKTIDEGLKIFGEAEALSGVFNILARRRLREKAESYISLAFANMNRDPEVIGLDREVTSAHILSLFAKKIPGFLMPEGTFVDDQADQIVYWDTDKETGQKKVQIVFNVLYEDASHDGGPDKPEILVLSENESPRLHIIAHNYYTPMEEVKNREWREIRTQMTLNKRLLSVKNYWKSYEKAPVSEPFIEYDERFVHYIAKDRYDFWRYEKPWGKYIPLGCFLVISFTEMF